MLKNKHNITAFLLVVLLIISLTNITAFAGELSDSGIKGTITIIMKKDGKAVPGGEFELYHIADMQEADTSKGYAFTKDFKNCGISLDSIDSNEFSSDLERYIKTNKISGIKKNVDRNGTVKFSSLETGIYFVIQNEAAKGYSKANSFTVLLPAFENGEYNYNINANPKFSFDDSEATTQTTTENPKTTKPADNRLPKTGQLNMPVPILTVSGICMLVSGLIIRHSGRKEENEE